MSTEDTYIPFSQRTGLAQRPPQLGLGEVSSELRRLFYYYLDLEIEREECFGVDSSYFDGDWKRVAKDLHVLFFRKSSNTFTNSPYELRQVLDQYIKAAEIGRLFDLVEFFVRHPKSSSELKQDLSTAFVSAKAAYRIIENQIVAIGTEQQAEAFEVAIAATEASGAVAARKHLIDAGVEIRAGNWSSSVRESIHAVEAMALMLVPKATTLGPALSKLEKEGYLHGSLKSAFSTLYGYASDEEGVRHALVFKDEAQVDEADALFMLGACASFVSYLIMRSAGE
ncbi:AbiJ-NTD4 domain-containing protein [Ruegeria sp. YS9]|uniref:AbiJ-NTD4 domain-containing protein n=1 Tax=Ruegeria sp. YS9 TaxID=2966453 RepID=UPI00214AE9F5|nr:hypothetical protein [Ruegeria sp. YS9]UUV05770.1 hypothetical protein NOR97_14240 [Ruegeria sp. YS9]